MNLTHTTKFLISFFFLMAFLGSIFFFSSITKRTFSIPPRYAQYAEDITFELASHLIHKHRMKILDRPLKHLNLIEVSFQKRGPLSQEELRAILVDSLEVFSQGLNENGGVRAFLKAYPFKIKGIEVNLFVVDEEGNPLHEPFICAATARENSLTYVTKERMEPFHFEKRLEEDFDEAFAFCNL